MSWTRFMDMHSGGGQKLDWAYIYIEAPIDEAKVIFYNRFERSPDRVTCTCCGGDYTFDESETLEQATTYDRGLRYVSPLSRDQRFKASVEEVREANEKSRYLEPGEEIPEGWHVDGPSFGRKAPGISLDEYLGEDGICVVRAEEITDANRGGAVPDEGFVWAGGAS